MARFFFHFRQHGTFCCDDQGSEFPTVEEAYLSAFRAAQDMWHELLLQRQDPRTCSFEVTDSGGRMLFVLPFMEILDTCTKAREDSGARPSLKTSHRRAQDASDDIKSELTNVRNSLAESLTLLTAMRKFE